MDFLTHLSLPLALVFVYRRDLAQSSAALGLCVFAVFPDFDKFLGMQGLFHSLVALLPLSLGIVILEGWLRDRLRLSPIIIALLGSHLLLDFIDGGPVPLLFPLIETGVGLGYPATLTFGQGILGVAVNGPLVVLRTPVPRSGFQSFGFITGTGIMSLLVFTTIYVKQRGRWHSQGRRSNDSLETDRQGSKESSHNK